MGSIPTKAIIAALLIGLGAGLSGCAGRMAGQNEQVSNTAVTAKERDCLIRAMYFESNRSSRRGLLAVGTVVMNRVKSPLYPNTICGVVGQPHQFAPGVLTRKLDPAELPLVEHMADAVIRGKRNRKVGDAMYFHMASYHIPYHVHYMTVAGGNAFYEKIGVDHGYRGQGAKSGTGQKAIAEAGVPMPSRPPELTAETGGGPSFFNKLGAIFSGSKTQSACDPNAGPDQAGLQQADFSCKVQPSTSDTVTSGPITLQVSGQTAFTMGRTR